VKRSLALLAVLVVTAGCTLGESLQNPGESVDMTTATIAGTWHGGTQRFVTFAEDGTFTALNLPPDMFEKTGNSPDPAAPPIDASGRYSLGSPTASVVLTFEHQTEADVMLGSTTMDAFRHDDGKVYLVFSYVGSLGNMTTSYLKCASDCVLPSRRPPSAGPTAIRS